MRKLNIVFIMSLLFLQAHSVTFRITDTRGQAISNACVSFNQYFGYTDSLGMVKIDTGGIAMDTLRIHHISFEPQNKFINIVGKDFFQFEMEDGFYPLNEITVSNKRPDEWVKMAINRIKDNFHIPLLFGLWLNADVYMTDSKGDKIFEYRGALGLRSINKHLYASCNKPIKRFVNDISDYIYTIKPNNFVNILSIAAHPVIRDCNKYDFYDMDWVKYKGIDAVKIKFQRKHKEIAQDGFMIIGADDMAILHVCYTISDIKDWMGEKTKRGIIKTSMLGYYVSVEYYRDTSGLYSFKSGNEKISLLISNGKKKIRTNTYTNLLRTQAHERAEYTIPIKKLFLDE